MNLGANEPSEFGLYYSWGNTEGHEPGDGYEFTQTNYENSPGFSISQNLESQNDAAHVALGMSWRMPSASEAQELLTFTTQEWVWLGEKLVVILRSVVNGQSVAIPAAGRADGSSYSGFNELFKVWLSTFYNDSLSKKLSGANGRNVTIGQENRHNGYSIRPVWDPGL
jgi:hypothetical protein